MSENELNEIVARAVAREGSSTAAPWAANNEGSMEGEENGVYGVEDNDGVFVFFPSTQYAEHIRFDNSRDVALVCDAPLLQTAVIQLVKMVKEAQQHKITAYRHEHFLMLWAKDPNGQSENLLHYIECSRDHYAPRLGEEYEIEMSRRDALRDWPDGGEE